MMSLVREAWTDERLDDLADRVDRGFEHVDAEMNRRFDRVDAEFDKVRAEMREGFREQQREMNERFIAAEVSAKASFDGIHARFDALNRTMIIGLVTFVASLFAASLF